MKVLFISAWYPNRYDSMEGLFVRKHAEAVNLYADTKVLYVHADKNIEKFEIVRQNSNQIEEIIVYYPSPKSGFLKKFVKSINYFKAYKIGLKTLISEGWLPEIVQANVFTRTAFIAYLIKLKYKIPFAVIEHWTRYFREITFSNSLHKFISNFTCKKADAVLPVTFHLQKNMELHGMKNTNYQVVNNVCEDWFFEKKASLNNSKARILNVTCFDDAHKNITGILRVVKELSKKRDDFEVYLIGDGVDLEKIKDYYNTLGIPAGLVHFTGLLEGKALVEEFQNCDFTILFSNYENIPVVISESFACGKPMISTSVGGINEHINDENGILIEKGDETALLNSIDFMIDNYKKYNAEKIQQKAYEKYSYEHVGKRLSDIYKQILDL